MPTQYCSAGNGNMLDILVHQNVRLSGVIVPDVLISDYVQILSNKLENIELGIFRIQFKILRLGAVSKPCL